MKRILLTFGLILTIGVAFGQVNTPKEYSDFTKKADSLFKAGNYAASGLAYCSAFDKFGGKGFENDRYNAACAWALADNADSAFSCLDKLVKKSNYSDYVHLSLDQDLITLHNNKRWQPLLKMVRKNKEKDEVGFNIPIIRVIDSLLIEDQRWRRYSTKDSGTDTISKETISGYLQITDSLNYYPLRSIFKQYSFPNYDLVGKESSDNFWLLTQHQDKHPGFQDSVLNAMKYEVDREKATVSRYAYLVDRVKINRSEPQVYGTQVQMNKDSTSYEPISMMEPEKVNDRRKTVGLPPVEYYIEIMNDKYFGALRKKEGAALFPASNKR